MPIDGSAFGLIDAIIQSYQSGLGRQAGRQAGIPIGNLTAQIFANIYLNEFDQFVLHSLKPLGYTRYGDDFVLWFPDELSAREARIIGM